MTAPTPKPIFRWLQISDLHVFDCAESNLMTCDFQDLKENFRPDFLVVTGDFRSLNRKSETSFEKTLSYLNAVVDQLWLDKKDVFLVPGNHDVYDYGCREAAITTICAKIGKDSNCYQEYYGKSTLDLMDGFSEYHKFVKAFYGDSLASNDPRIATPAKVFSLPWRNCLNLIFVNTVLVSDGKDHDQLCDIKGLTELNIQNNYPCIILAHHSPDRLFPKHRGLLPGVCKKFHVRAWLSGDAHRYDKKGIDRVDVPNLQTPVFVCGKTAIQTDDNYSAFGAIGYTCHDDGKVSVQAFSYEREAEDKPYRFVHSPKFDLGINQPYTFPLYDTAPNPPLPSAKEVHNPGASLTETDKEDFSYCTPSWDLVVRDQEKQEILQLFSQSTAQICWVIGMAGIGKTTFCMDLCRAMESSNHRIICVCGSPTTGRSNFLSHIAAGLKLNISSQQNVWNSSIIPALKKIKKEQNGTHFPLIYFDNFEDVLALPADDLGHINFYLSGIKSLGYHLLFSSQKMSKAPNLRGTPKSLTPLQYKGAQKSNEQFLSMDSAKLFCSVWGKEPKTDEEWALFRKLIQDLSGHPLAIVLTANMANSSMLGLKAVAEHWYTATSDPEHPNDRHTSLKNALTLLWNRLQGHKGAVQFWALQSHSVLPIPQFMLEDLQGELSEEELTDGMQKLWEYQLISEEDNTISMLPPIKKQFPLLGDTAQAQKSALLLWANSLLQLLDRANNWSNQANNNEAHLQAISLRPQFLYIIDKLKNMEEYSSLFEKLNHATRNYFRSDLSSPEPPSHLPNTPV